MIQNIEPKRILDLGARLYVFIFLNIYGLGKIMGQQFYRKENLPDHISMQPLGEVNSFDLAWTFMGHSQYYILFIGISQIIGAWMLLWKRTKLLGVAILIPIMVNIIVFDIIFLDAYGALVSATIYFSLLILILFLNKGKVIDAFKSLTRPKESDPLDKKNNLAISIILMLLSMGLLFGVDQLLVNFFGHGAG